MSGNDRSGTPDGVPDDDRSAGSAERSDAPGGDDPVPGDDPSSADAATGAGDDAETATTERDSSATAERERPGRAERDGPATEQRDGPATVEASVDDLTIPPRSLHPRVRIVWVLRGLVSAALVSAIVGVVGAVIAGADTGLAVGSGVFLVVGTLTVAHAIARYRIWSYEVREDALYLERGVLTRVRTVVPYVRIQHVDASRGPLERTFGLASSVVYTAGSRGADVTIPGLTPEKSEDLQERLKRLAILAEGDDAV